MTVPVENLSRTQKLWYGNLVLAAILADEEINVSEVDFLKQVIALVDPQDRPSLMKMLEAKKMPPLMAPSNDMGSEILAAIYLELILIVISDMDYAKEEEEFLNKVAELFSFTTNYKLSLHRWLEEGLKWKLAQSKLIPGGSSMTSVPLKELNGDQKKWYATTLISTILLDGRVDQMEMSFLKMAISFLDEKKDQAELMAYVKNKMCPTIKSPPGMSNDILTLIFIEVLLIVSADETISFTEQKHLQGISDQCNFDRAHFDSLLNWCNRGVQWKNSKNSLIAKVKRDIKPDAANAPQALEGNNSLHTREFTCHVCESKKKITYYQLKPKSQKPSRNIFGNPTYRAPFDGSDYVDFNKVGLIICPYCYYSSTNKDNFKRTPEDKAPSHLANPKFKETWMRSTPKRGEKFGDHLEETQSYQRSLPCVIAAYQAAIEGEKLLAEIMDSWEHRWTSISLRLVMAEILMSEKKRKPAEEILKSLMEPAKEIFDSRAKPILIYKAARILFLIGLYFGNRQLYSPYYDFFSSLANDKKNPLSAEEGKIVTKIFGELKKAYESRNDYKQESLEGFHLK